jgi:prolyl 4-hydroxylase
LDKAAVTGRQSAVALIEQVQRLARSGRQRDAVALVEKSADLGDPDALFMCGSWRLYGRYGPRDLALSHRMLGAAVKRGHVEATKLQAVLIGNGTGVPGDPDLAKHMLERLAPGDPDAARQLSVLADTLGVDWAGESSEPLADDPEVRLIRGLLSNQECEYVIDAAGPMLQPSQIVHPVTKRPVPNPVRNSMGMNFGPWNEDLVIHALNHRIASASGTDADCGERLHVLRYSGGQEFKPHLDALPAAKNQRTSTVLLYLNEGYSGGETDFPELKIRVRGGTGDALIFKNVGLDGQVSLRARHAGLPVQSGSKWIASRWIRSAPISPWDGE